MTWALLLALQASASLESGLLAEREGRHAEAVLLLEPLMRTSPTYEGLVALGLAQARLGDVEDARASFDHAIRLDASRPEALVERSGLDFLAKRYEAAAGGLARALHIRDDPYARDLRASALQLAGRSDEALEEWNRLGEPRLGEVRFTGLLKTRDRVARREVRLAEGELLKADSFRETRLRLREVGVFPLVRLRAVPREDRRADVEIALTERHGLGSWQELLGTAVANALRHQVRLWYFNLGGEGVVLRAEYKWEDTQPHVGGAVSWPRPFGLPARLVVSGLRARPSYTLEDGPLILRTRGPDVALRRVAGARTVVEAGWRFRDRTYSRPRPDAPDGTLSALTVGVERSLVETYRHRLQASIDGVSALGGLGSDVSFARGTVALRYEHDLLPSDDHVLAPSTVAARAVVGSGTSGTPLDEMYAPGAGSEVEYTLRGHDQKESGVLGVSPIGRTMALLNFEWRQRFWARPLAQVGFVVFGDVIQITRRSAGDDATLADVGLGLRIGWAGSRILRFDYGWSLSGDGRSAFSAGFGQAF